MSFQHLKEEELELKGDKFIENYHKTRDKYFPKGKVLIFNGYRFYIKDGKKYTHLNGKKARGVKL